MSSLGKNPKSDVVIASIASEPIGATDQQSQLDFELAFFNSILQRNPDYVDALRVHGNNLTLKGRYEDGLAVDRRLVDLRPHDALAHYNLACSYSLVRKVDQALRLLRRALELGYRDFGYMREDRDLAFVRKDRRFGKLLREFEDC